MFLKNKKSQLDERQEQVLLKIYSNGCRLVFWGLFLAILLQGFRDDGFYFRNVMGELIIFFLLDAYLLIACLKNGIWDRKLEPNFKTNLGVATVAGIATGIVVGLKNYALNGVISWAALSGLFVLVFTTLIFLAILLFCSSIYHHRAHKLEREEEL